METVTRTTFSEAEHALWRRIEAHPFEPDGHALTFTARLARDYGWDLAFARSLVNEYRRFCFLAVVSDRAVTPSEEVDAVWHQHLTDSRDYWDHWCRVVLRTDLHHDPTRGGAAEPVRFVAQYAETLALYESYFGSPVPAAWPGTADRFRARARYRVVDRDRAIVLPVGSGLARLVRRMGRLVGLSSVLAVLSPASAIALPADPLDWTAGPFLSLYAVVILVAVALALGVRRAIGNTGHRPRSDGLGEIELAYLSGGPTRAADTLILGFMLAGAARLDGTIGLIAFDDGTARLPRHLTPFAYEASGSIKRSALVKRLAARLAPTRDALIDRGLLLGPDRTALSVASTLAIMGLAVGFGALKILVGLSRNKPVGFLIMLVIAAALAGLVLCLPSSRRTRAGDETLSDYRSRHERAARAPCEREIALAFALAGPVALAGTAYAAYADLLKRSDGSGGDSGGGDGGGGGGCGGCGGGH